MASYNSADVQCPFYRRDEPGQGNLTCESVLPGGTVRTHFATREALQTQIRKYCAGDYRGCPWYQVVSYKWEKLG